MECANKTVLDRLSTAILESHLPWDKVCSSMVYTYNVTVHQTTEEMLFKTMFGRDPVLPMASPLTTIISLQDSNLDSNQALLLKAGWTAAQKISQVKQAKRK